MNMDRFENRKVVITGGASGFGRATAYITGTVLCVDGGRAGLDTR